MVSQYRLLMQAYNFTYEHGHVISSLTQASLHRRLPGPLFITIVFGIIRTHCAAETCDYLQKATHDSLSCHYVENKKARYYGGPVIRQIQSASHRGT